MMSILAGTSKISSHLGGGGVRRLEVAVEMGVVTLFITLQFNHTYCVCGKCKAPFITCRIFSIFS